MNFPTELFGEVLVVHTPDELCAEHIERFETFLNGLPNHWIVLDIDHTENLDSAGLAAILGTYDRLREQEGDLKIATTNVVNRKILELTRLDQSLEVFDSVVDAVNSFQTSFSPRSLAGSSAAGLERSPGELTEQWHTLPPGGELSPS